MYHRLDEISTHVISFMQDVDSGNASIAGAVDTLGHSGGLLIITSFLSTVGASVTITNWKVQESDDNSTFTDVPGCNALTDTQIDGSASVVISGGDDDNSVVTYYVPLIGARKRYHQVLFTNTQSGRCDYTCIATIIGKDVSPGPKASEQAGPQGAIFRAENV